MEKAKRNTKKQRGRHTLRLGVLNFFLNRTNFSGVINGGVIGGLKQWGKYKIDCRYNKKNLILRIKEIVKHKKNIHIYNLDAVELVEKIQKKSKNSQTIFYFDPPYYLKGPSLYTNYYKYDDHREISLAIKKIRNSRWIVSYDNVSEIKSLYRGFKKIEYSFFHAAHKPKAGKEILFFNKNLIIPKIQNPIKI